MNAQNEDQETPLHFASKRGHLEVVRLLLGHGADVHIRGSESRTPFQQATEEGHHEIAQLLLEHGAQREYVHGLLEAFTSVDEEGNGGHR